MTIAHFRFTSPHAVNRVGYDDATPDLYVPVRMTKKRFKEPFSDYFIDKVFTILQFIFYFGWLHVAEVIIRPLFPLSCLII